MGIARIMSYEDRPEALADRAYRLHYNASQNRTDTFARVRGGGTGGWAVLGEVTHGMAQHPIAHECAELGSCRVRCMACSPQVGALIGGVAAVASRGASLRTALGGGAIGSALGVLAHVATSSKETSSPMPNAMLDELKSG